MNERLQGFGLGGAAGRGLGRGGGGGGGRDGRGAGVAPPFDLLLLKTAFLPEVLGLPAGGPRWVRPRPCGGGGVREGFCNVCNG